MRRILEQYPLLGWFVGALQELRDSDEWQNRALYQGIKTAMLVAQLTIVAGITVLYVVVCVITLGLFVSMLAAPFLGLLAPSLPNLAATEWWQVIYEFGIKAWMGLVVIFMMTLCGVYALQQTRGPISRRLLA